MNKKRCAVALGMALLVTGICGAWAEENRAENLAAEEIIRPHRWTAQVEMEKVGYLLDDSANSVYSVALPPELRTDQEPEISFDLGGETLTALLIRNGDQRNGDFYAQQGRIRALELTAVTEHGTDSFAFELMDDYRMEQKDPAVPAGYQYIRLPREWAGVHRLEIWIRDIYPGSGQQENVCITDISLRGRKAEFGNVQGQDEASERPGSALVQREGEQATISSDAQAYYGPGTEYSPYPRPLSAGLTGTILAREGDYVQFSFAEPETGVLTDVWVSESAFRQPVLNQ